MALQPAIDGRAAAVPAGEGDVGVEGAALGRGAGGLAGALDLGGQRFHLEPALADILLHP